MRPQTPDSEDGFAAYWRNKPKLARHEEAMHLALAERIAKLKGLRFAGAFDERARHPSRRYCIPGETIAHPAHAQELGIAGEHDLFGGVVPFPFAGTKAITQPLLRADACAPPGWSHDVHRVIKNSVLDGFSAFSPDDARAAGAQILQRHGSVRVKPVSGVGGRGQTVATSLPELDDQIALIDPAEIAQWGVVLEQNLEDVETISVGQVRVAELVVSYWGRQHLTKDNRGETVYGGSTLFLVRGDFDALLRSSLPDKIVTAVAQARCYDGAIDANFPGAYASRRNYDVAQGRDARGAWRSGVLEQSWRIGGATGAEVAGLEAFRADPTLQSMTASTVERYGADLEAPEDATVYFRGEDPALGPMLKYAIPGVA